MFNTMALPLQLAGLWTACATTAPNVHVYKATMARDRLRNFDNSRPWIVRRLVVLAEVLKMAPAMNAVAATVIREHRSRLDMTAPFVGARGAAEQPS
jgi:hypothetical protein